jgi:hypothetical protein
MPLKTVLATGLKKSIDADPFGAAFGEVLAAGPEPSNAPARFKFHLAVQPAGVRR